METRAGANRAMLENINQLHHFILHAKDGVIGKLEDTYFDDIRWTIRYLVVSADGALTGRRVLISPVTIRTLDWREKEVFVELSCDQVRNSPDSGTDKPVSRQHELELGAYYGWPPYWPVVPFGMEAIPPPNLVAESPEETSGGDPHLRSAREVKGYHIEALDGEVGHVSDFVFDDRSWEIPFLVVDAGTWLHKRHVLVKPEWIEAIRWEERHVIVRLTREAVKNSPELAPHFPLPPEYVDQLLKHYREKG